jgi:hypothetical protein
MRDTSEHCSSAITPSPKFGLTEYRASLIASNDQMASTMTSTKKPFPDLSGIDYAEDLRFVAEKQMDLTGTRPHRQYVCDNCRHIIVRRMPGVPQFDGQYVYWNRLQHDQRNTCAMKNAWLTQGWDASFWCTACWCKLRYKYKEPLSEYEKMEVRFILGLVNKQKLDSLCHGARRYGSVHQWGPVQYPIQVLDDVADNAWQG